MILVSVEDYQVNKLNNVYYTHGLLPPDWYNILKSGYVYLWINYTNLDKNKKIKNWEDKLPVYYLGYHGPKLGYIDGSYWGSSESKSFFKDKDNPQIRWGFKVLGHFRTHQEAHDMETKKLQQINKDKKEWKLYYNKKVGGSGIKEINDDYIYELHLKIEKSIVEFMDDDKKYDKTIMEHNVNGYKIKLTDMDIIEKFEKLQLAKRQESSTVLTSVKQDVSKNKNATMIPPIISSYINDGQYYSEYLSKYIVGDTLIHGNTREQGIREGEGSRAWVIYIPQSEVVDFDQDHWDEFAGYFNKADTRPRQEMNNEWYTLRLVKRWQNRKIPIESLSTEKFLDRSQLSDERKDLIKQQALANKNLIVDDKAYINWNKGSYSSIAWKELYESTKKTNIDVLKMSAGSYRISTILKRIRKWNNDLTIPPLKELIIDLAFKIEQIPSKWEADDKNGLLLQLELLEDVAPPVNRNGKKVKITHRLLPQNRPKIGIDYNNIWKTKLGKVFLDRYNIKVKKGK